MSDVIIFRQHEDGSVTADGFPDEIELTPMALGDTRNEVMRVFVEIVVANGRTTYELTSYDPAAQRFTAKKVIDV